MKVIFGLVVTVSLLVSAGSVEVTPVNRRKSNPCLEVS